MKNALYILVFLLTCFCSGQIKTSPTKFPKKTIPEMNSHRIPPKSIPKIPSKKPPKMVILEPTLSGNWTNLDGHMIYFTKYRDDVIYFFAEEKLINPAWSIVGKALLQSKGVYRFEYGVFSDKGTLGFDNWILNDKLMGSFMNAESNQTWQTYHKPLVRSNSDYKPPVPKPASSAVYTNMKVYQDGIFTDARREIMWRLRTVGNQVFMYGETVAGNLLFFGSGIKENISEGRIEAYLLTIDLTRHLGNDTARYTLLLDRDGISYIRSSDCYESRNELRRDCPNGMIIGKTIRAIPLEVYDFNRTANVQENSARNRHYFEYVAPISENRDTRNKDMDGDGHNSLAYDGDDCDDNDPNKFPGNPEVPDFEGHDEDCDPLTIGTLDRDGDGYTDWRVCNKDKNGRIITSGDDCDDTDPAKHPGQPEVCDGKDNNCNGYIDEGVSILFYRDSDQDGFGDPDESLAKRACSKPVGYVENNRDCDDSDSTKTTDCK